MINRSQLIRCKERWECDFEKQRSSPDPPFKPYVFLAFNMKYCNRLGILPGLCWYVTALKIFIAHRGRFNRPHRICMLVIYNANAHAVVLLRGILRKDRNVFRNFYIRLIQSFKTARNYL